MKISVVTAVYNRQATIVEAIESLQAQTHTDFEHVIQDGGSTDGTIDLIKSATDERARLKSEPDEGIYDAINRGILRAEGEVIGLMHSDDVFATPRVLEKVAKCFSKPDIAGVYGDLEYVSAGDTDKVVRYWKSGSYTPDLLSKGWMPPHPTLYLRREVFERFGLFDTSYRIAADYDAMLRYLGKGGIKLAYIPEVLVRMRVGGASNRSLKQLILKSREDYRAIKSSGTGGIGTLTMKNLSKLGQFAKKG